MREVYREHPDSPLVATLFAESLMNLQPWKHFLADGTQGEHTDEIVEVLERGLRRVARPSRLVPPVHPRDGSLARRPRRRWLPRERLGNAVPGSGHLIHMPTHIDVLSGRLRRRHRSNQSGD